MTTQITPSDTFLGWPATKLKTMLNSWERGRCDPHHLSDLKALDFTTGACAAFIGECFDRGFITVGYPDELEEDWEKTPANLVLKLSDAGHAIASASAQKRASKERAAGALEKIITNAERLANDPNALRKVSQIWVFGSFIDNTKADVGDLDVVVTTHRNPKLKGMETRDRLAHLREHYPDVVPHHVMFYNKESEWTKRMIFGSRRDPLVSPNSIENLIAMHRPCRQVYDMDRGGRIPPEDHPHHPESVGRSNHMRNRLSMPDLGGIPDQFRPISAAVYMWPEEIAAGAPATLGQRSLDTKELERFGNRVLDGRNGFALVLSWGRENALLHIKRNAEFKSDTWSYNMAVEAVHVPHRFLPDRWRLHEMTTMIGGLFNGDLLRLADRRAKMHVYPEIYADIEFCTTSSKVPDLVHMLQSAVGEPWHSNSGHTLPQAYQYGIDLSVDGDFQVGYSCPEDFDDEDWRCIGIPKADYEEWARGTEAIMNRDTRPPGL